jgi:predicted metal-binding membrane protein
MNKTVDDSLHRLPPTGGWFGALFASPKLIAVVCVLTLTGLGWLYLALQITRMGGSLGVLTALCQPTFGVATPESAVGGFAVVVVMWAAMVLAMMAPSAAPMILTYAEIADTAGRKGEPIVSPVMIAAGYTVVWLGFAAFATILQFVLTRAALIDASMASASGLFSGAIFIGAGLYQFSALKHACLRQCRAPFPFFFSHWQTSARGVFRLGLQQGLHCLGCCWAMMLVMFAVGAMNVIWMAALGIVMTLEKMTSSERYTQMVGAVLIAIGAAFALTAIAAHWPQQVVSWVQ